MGLVPEDQHSTFLQACFLGRAADAIVARFGDEDLWSTPFVELVPRLNKVFQDHELDHEREARFMKLRLQQFPSIFAMLQQFDQEVARTRVIWMRLGRKESLYTSFRTFQIYAGPLDRRSRWRWDTQRFWSIFWSNSSGWLWDR